MGAESSAQRDDGTQEDASASASSGKDGLHEGSSHEHKPLQKNGQISSMTSLNGLSEDNTLADVAQPDGVSVAPKEDVPETMETVQDEVTTQLNGEKVEKESPDANEISTVEEKVAEEKPEEASEVGFKKIFRFVGFKFTLKKDKTEEKDPVKLLTVKDKEEDLSEKDDSAKDDEATTAEEKTTAEEVDNETKASTVEADATGDDNKAEPADDAAEATNAEVKDEAKEEEAKNEEETTPPLQETAVSPFRKFFSGGLFSNLRKKASIKKTKDEQDKEAAVDKEADETVKDQEDKEVSEQETNQEVRTEEKAEAKEEAQTSPEEAKPESTSEPEVSDETAAPTEATAGETKQEEQKTEESVAEEKVVAEVTSEAELLPSQEKTKPQGSPLKKLFTGAGLKKLSTKKQKSKKDTESKAAESAEQTELQSSTESAELPKADSGPSSPEESGEHVLSVEQTQNEASQETEGEVVSDGEKKKEGIIAWSSFKKLVTPKKRVKRSSESDDEATGDKPAKSATLSSSESAVLADKSVEEDTKEEKPSEEEPKTENTEKLVSSTEEPKKKMDTSVSWEALMCMGGPKKRTRKTSDSDDEETKIEEDVPAATEGEQEGKTEVAVVMSQSAESEGEGVSSPEALCSSEKETTWDTLKRMVMSKSKPKVDEKSDDNADQVLSDSETPKDESTFSLRKFFPGRRKKKVEKQASGDSGEDDSDTPAVVPLSEYDKPDEPEPEAPSEPPVPQSDTSTEERSPSWIPVIVEDDVRDQLSDIPEEAATPKSVDTDIADEENEDQAAFLKASGRTGRRLSTAEVKPVAPAPDAATTPVPQGPKSESAMDVTQGLEPHINSIPVLTSATVEDVPLEVASEHIEYEPTMETAKSLTNTLLEPHACEEAMAICTGLGTKEIAKVAVEKPVMSTVESVTVIRDALTTEVTVEEKPESVEEAVLKEDQIHKAQMIQIETTELEHSVVESTNNIMDLQAATGSLEPEIEKIAVVSTTLEESGIIQLPEVNANSPKTEIISPLIPVSEIAVCAQSVEVSEVTIETKETKMEMEQLEATEGNAPVKELVKTVSEEISTICETATSTITEETEAPIPDSIQSMKTPVITETKILVAPLSIDSDSKAASESEPEQVHVEPIPELETKEVTAFETSQVTTKDEPLGGDITEVSEDKPKEPKGETNQVTEIEAQSMAITQSVIQDAVDMVSDDAPEAPEPSTPSTVVPEIAQATATTEAEIDTSAEVPVVTDTPVPVLCEKAKSPQLLCAAVEVLDSIPIEVTKNLEKEEEKPKEDVKKAAEVKVSEETVTLEEVEEIKTESLSEEKLEQINTEESKEVKETAEDGKSEEVMSKATSEETKTDETKPEAPSEEAKTDKTETPSEEAKSEVPLEEPKPEEAPSEDSKVKSCEIHMPVQVVLQTAQVLEEPSVEQEAAEEFDTNGHDGKDTVRAPGNKLPVLAEEAQESPVEEASGAPVRDEAEVEKPQPTKCAEVMAQVIEVIEEAVKEIEPVSSEITAAS